MLCKNSWIDLSWDGKSNRVGKENLLVQFSQKAKTLLPINKACDLVATEIADTYKNIFVCLSGGSDSENMVNTFVRNKIKFTVLILNYDKIINKNGLLHQEYELQYAHKWCRLNQIQPLEIDASDFINNSLDKQRFQKIKPRIIHGHATANALEQIASCHDALLVAGYQLEYYPDHEQMQYLQTQLTDYRGFVMEESDAYIEIMTPNQHPWAFYYWNPEIMASFVNVWDENLTMQQNKAQIYNIEHRPKFAYSTFLYHPNVHTYAQQKWGTRDCALLGTKDQLLSQLLE
jgi:hypothetical protein